MELDEGAVLTGVAHLEHEASVVGGADEEIAVALPLERRAGAPDPEGREQKLLGVARRHVGDGEGEWHGRRRTHGGKSGREGGVGQAGASARAIY